MKYNYLVLLVVVWWVGAALATGAIFLPVYNDFVAVGVAGWATIVVCSGLIAYELKRIKAEDKKKEIQNG